LVGERQRSVLWRRRNPPDEVRNVHGKAGEKNRGVAVWEGSILDGEVKKKTTGGEGVAWGPGKTFRYWPGTDPQKHSDENSPEPV